MDREAGATDTADPLGGAYFIEAMTQDLQELAWELIERVDELGGAVAAVESGWVKEQIEDAAFRHNAQVEAGERVIVGVNKFEEAEEERIQLLRIDPEVLDEIRGRQAVEGDLLETVALVGLLEEPLGHPEREQDRAHARDRGCALG